MYVYERKLIKKYIDMKYAPYIEKWIHIYIYIYICFIVCRAAGVGREKVEDDATEKNLYLLQRAYELRQEQEEEVKNVNSLVLATKCMLIREAQIKEKEVSSTQNNN